MSALRSTLHQAAEWARQTRVYEWRQRRQGRARGPRLLHPHGRLEPGSADITFVVVCGAEFDQAMPNAATMSRMGWCHGFESIGVPYLLVSVFELDRILPALDNPICWIAGSDYVYLDRANFRCLQRYPHAVLVSTAFKGDAEHFRRNGYPQQSWPARLRGRIRASSPRFFFTMSGESRFGFYEGWRDGSTPLVSLPLACDTQLYGSPPPAPELDPVEIAFVGGFWPYKGRQFDLYLKPFADRLDVFGYSAWPYGRFRGQLRQDKEGSLYAQARVSPVINEPHVCAMGVDLNERAFKVLGAGGLAITDATAGYREWFTSDELLVPNSLNEYRDMMHAALADPQVFSAQRERGRQAVLARHTYLNRAQAFCRQFGIDPSPRAQAL